MQEEIETGTLERYVPRMLLARIGGARGDLVEMLEGTAVFADVSGFTRLSERLARKGQEGAEHLVDAINACFSALLGDAYVRGGSLLKFGGDAMLLWFEGEEHALRACASAAAMRRTLRDVGRIRAGASEVVLRMSVGVHAGTYAMFLVGGSHRELLIGGAPASEVVALESAASAGQILLSPATAELLPRGCRGAAVGPGTLLARAPSARDWTAPNGRTEVDEEAVAECLPSMVRAHVVGGHAAAEHRTATIAFLHFGELDSVIAQRGAQEAAERLDEVVQLVQTATERYEVCFLDSDIASNGAKIRLSAGAPRVVGDDEERMLLALRRIVEADPPLPVQVGVNRGPVFTGEVGPAYRRWYAVMGDTVNLAARLAGRAPAGRVYATRGVLDCAKFKFRETAIEPFVVKGKARPVEAWEVGATDRAASATFMSLAALRTELPLVGREREVELLRSAIDSAQHGSGGLVELVGETGTGKSRLLAETQRLGEGMRSLHATCEVFTRDTPYAIWRELLRQLLELGWDDRDDVVLARLKSELERVDPDLLPWLPLIAIVLDVDVAPSPEVQQLAPEARSAKLHEVVLRFLRQALVVPTIVDVEHAHLMDAASVGLFEALTHEIASSSWLVLVTRRDEPGGLTLAEYPHSRIELGLLPREDIHAIAVATPDAIRVPPHVLELAVERSGGSPQFLLDLLAAAAAGNRDELPDTVGAATVARIDALDPRDRAVVRRAAVLGLTFHPRRLADVLEGDVAPPDEGFWDRLVEVFAREDDGHVRFKRPALQEAAYSSLPFKLRRELHLAVGLQLEHDQGREPDADPAVLSHHFAYAGDYARAHHYAMAAAERATERSSHADAARLYRRAIEAARANAGGADPKSLAVAWERLGDALRRTGEPGPAARAITEARRLLRDDPIAQARLCHLRAQSAQQRESVTVVVRWLKRGLRGLEDLNGPEAVAWRARLHSFLGAIRSQQARWAEAISECQRAITEAESVGEMKALAHAYYALDRALVESGRREEATHSTNALEIYQRLGDAEHEFAVLNNLGMFAYFEGRWGDAAALYRQAGEAAARAGMPAAAAYTDCNLGEILSDQGHDDEAETYLERARRVWAATGDRPGVAFLDMLLARLAVRRGNLSEGLPSLEAATVELHKFQIDAYANLGQALIAEAEALAGDPFRALEIASRELEADDRLRPLLTRVAGIALARLGQLEAATRELGHSMRTARERGGEYDLAAAIDALDAIGGADADLVSERDQIMARLKITRLPALALAEPMR